MLQATASRMVGWRPRAKTSRSTRRRRATTAITTRIATGFEPRAAIGPKVVGSMPGVSQSRLPAAAGSD